MKKFCFCDDVKMNNSTTSRMTCFFVLVLVFPLVSSRVWSHRTGKFLEECNTSRTRSQRSTRKRPSVRRPAFKEITSDSDELWETEICFQPIRTECSISEDTQNSVRNVFNNLQSLHQNLNIGTIPIDNPVPYYPHDNSACYHSCGECKRSNMPNVGQKLWSIAWQLVQMCLQNKICQIQPFRPHTSMSRRFGSKLLKILKQFPILPFWTDGRPSME